MTETTMQMTLSDFIQLGSVTVVLFSIGYGLVRGIGYLLERKARRLEAHFKSFDAVVAQLSSSNPSSQLAAAVLLRRLSKIGTLTLTPMLPLRLRFICSPKARSSAV